MMKKLIFCLALFVTLHTANVFGFDGLNPTPRLVSIGTGFFNITRDNHQTGLVQLEYKGQPFFGKRLFKVRGLLATLVTFNGSFWIGGGVNFDIWLGGPMVLTLGFAPGFYTQGNGKNLGYPLENRSSIELAYRFKNNGRLGAQFYHLSNASFSKRNPGAEVLTVFYAIPINSP